MSGTYYLPIIGSLGHNLTIQDNYVQLYIHYYVLRKIFIEFWLFIKK